MHPLFACRFGDDIPGMEGLGTGTKPWDPGTVWEHGRAALACGRHWANPALPRALPALVSHGQQHPVLSNPSPLLCLIPHCNTSVPRPRPAP